MRTILPRRQLALRRFAEALPYLVMLALPGSILWLPLYAWWQNRRRHRQPALETMHP